MDPAQAPPVDDRVVPELGNGIPVRSSPAIGVPAIPARPDRTRPPMGVPSADLDAEPGTGDVPVEPRPSDQAVESGLPDGRGEPAARPPLPLASHLPAAPGPSPSGPPAIEGIDNAGLGRPEAEPSGFGAGVSSKLKTYVYLLVDPRTGRVFFAGRGRGDRCFRHLQAARSGSLTAADGGSFSVLERIHEVESTGKRVRIDILRHGLTGDEADLVEAAVNDALGLPVASGSAGQRRQVSDISSQLAKRAKFKRAHQVVLLRVGPTGSDITYELARHRWRIGRRWTDLDSPRSPRYAVLVAGDLVAAVRRIDGWEPSPGPGAGVPGPAARFSFTGPVDAELEARYVGRSVAAYLGDGAPGPVTYVWCGPHWVNTPR